MICYARVSIFFQNQYDLIKISGRIDDFLKGLIVGEGIEDPPVLLHYMDFQHIPFYFILGGKTYRDIPVLRMVVVDG
jgi:hypothetical protein